MRILFRVSYSTSSKGEQPTNWKKKLFCKITNINDQTYKKKLFYFLVPKSSVTIGLDCVKKVGDEYLMLEPL
jgi:hypothetical protein